VFATQQLSQSQKTPFEKICAISHTNLFFLEKFTTCRENTGESIKKSLGTIGVESEEKSSFVWQTRA